ncbi:MAG TPA: hypothetical protein VFQ24_14400 [Terriglobia bacterium]|nr:hypothetical protein [Terriglobia bacterium]
MVIVTHTWLKSSEHVGGSLRKVLTVPVVGPEEDIVLPPQLIKAATANDKTNESASAVQARALLLLIHMVPPELSTLSINVLLKNSLCEVIVSEAAVVTQLCSQAARLRT